MGETMERAWLDEAIELAKALWRAYILEPTEEGGRFIFDSLFQSDFSLIGTGKHEMYPNLPAFMGGLGRDQEEAEGITCLLYTSLSVMLPRQHSPLCMCCHCNPNGTFERARTTTGKKGSP